MIISGRFVEILKFSRPLVYGARKKRRGPLPVNCGKGNRVVVDERMRQVLSISGQKPLFRKRVKKAFWLKIKKAEKEKVLKGSPASRAKALQRARSTVRRSINANVSGWHSATGREFMPVFITFTFAENIQKLQEANKLFTKAMKRLTWFLTKSRKSTLKYIAVPEFQERGAIHYHVIFFNLPFIENAYDEVRRIWKYGMVNVKAIYDVDNVGGYVTKYMVKDLEDPRLAGEKCHFASRGLKKPHHEYNVFKVRYVESRLPAEKKVVTKIYQSEFLGETEYTQYDLGRGGSLKDYGVVIREKEQYSAKKES